MGKIINKHKIFSDAYLASQLDTEKDRVAEAEAMAGYKPGGGARLLRLPDVKEYIEKRREMAGNAQNIMDIADSEEIVALINSIEMTNPENQQVEIADSDKVAAFFTAVMNAGGPDRFSSADLRDQIKAAEFLGKYNGMFSREQIEREPVQPVIISGDDDIES